MVFAVRLLALLGVAAHVHAQTPSDEPLRIDHPAGGMLHHSTEPSAISFRCSPIGAARISCEFTQFDAYVVQVFPTAEQKLHAFESHPPNAERCAAARAELEAPVHEVTRQRSGHSPEANQREELEAIVEYCETGGTEALRALYAREYERWQKTCTVSAHHYTQTLRRVSFDPERWATESPPYGECRQHHVAEFYRGADGLRYVAAYKVLNKSARMGEMRCHEMREQEAVFGPGPSNAAASRMTCETIDFSPGCHSPNFPCLGGPPVINVD